MKKLYKSILFLTLLISLLSSCSHELDLLKAAETTSQNTESTSTLTCGFIGSIDLHTNQSENSRAAIPSVNVNGTDFYYYVNAVRTDGGAGSFTIDGSNATDRAKLVYNTTTKLTDFEMGLTFGDWEITVSVKEAKEDLSNPDVLLETYPVTVSSENPIVKHNFILVPGTSGTGTIALPITVVTSVQSIELKCDELQDQIDEGKLVINKESNTSYTIDGTAIPSGIYSFVLRFYGNEHALLYKTLPVSVNVFDNMTTRTWVGDSVVPVSYSALNVSSNSITNFTGTTMYVGDTDYAQGNDDYSGSNPFTPLATVQEAINRIAASGSSSNDYTIKICGTVKDNVTITTTNFKTLTFDSASDTSGILDGDKKGSVITVNTNDTSKKITIKNLTITNGSGTPEEEDSTIKDGGGIYMKSGWLILHNGAKVTGNTATNGGGVYIKGGTFYMQKQSLIGDSIESTTTATDENSTTYANKAKYGGGVYLNGGSLLVGCDSSGSDWYTEYTIYSDYGIRRNYATEAGGGIYKKTGTIHFCTAHLSYNASGKDGGAAYIEGNYVNFHDGKIWGNKAIQKGGAIYIAPSYSVTFPGNGSDGVSLKENSVEASENNDAMGGAIYNEGTLTFNQKMSIFTNNVTASGSGNAYGGAIYNAATLNFNLNSYGISITKNKAKVTGTGAARGGAFYNSDTGSINMEYGTFASSNEYINTVEGDTAEGGAIYQNGTFKISRNSQSTNGSPVSFFAGSEKNNDIYLPSGKVIQINGALSSDKPIIATITPANFSTGIRVLEKTADFTDVDKFKEAIPKFTLSQTGDNESENLGVIYYQAGGVIGFDQSKITNKQWITNYMADKHWNAPGKILNDDNYNPNLLTLLLKNDDKYTVVTISLTDNSISKISYDLDFKVFDPSITSIHQEVSETNYNYFASLEGLFNFDGSIASDSDSAALTLKYYDGITSNVQWYWLQ